MAQINEFGEIIRDKAPNEKMRENYTLSGTDKMWMFFGNLFSIWTFGVFLFFNYRARGYQRKSKQVCAGSVVTAVIVVALVAFFAAVSGK